MMSWLLPRNKSASLTLPVGPSKTYSFSILTQGSLRRCRFKWSRSFENFFSFSRSFLRATSHSFCETTLRFSIPRTVLILGIIFSFGFFCFVHSCRRATHDQRGYGGGGYFSNFGNAGFIWSHGCASDVHTFIC